MIRLLVVDDSALMRRLMAELFEAQGDFELAVARNGLEALDQLSRFQPHVITLDVQMPQMDGLACLDRIMVERPTPVVMVSALTRAGAEETLEALHLGAVDFVPKPGRAMSLEMDELGPSLVQTVRAAAGARLRSAHRLAERVRARAEARAPAARRPATRAAAAPRASAGLPVPPPAPGPGAELEGLVIVGASTGGPAALDALLSGLPGGFPWPILVAQHMPSAFTGPFARRLDGICEMQVHEVTGPMPLAPGCVYIGRGEADLILGARPGGLVALSAPATSEFRWHPSVDRLTRSAMSHLRPERLVGVLMTGMGNDGAASMTSLRQAGGRTIAEAEETAVVWGMPGELVRAGGADIVAPLEDIASSLRQLVDPR